MRYLIILANTLLDAAGLAASRNQRWRSWFLNELSEGLRNSIRNPILCLQRWVELALDDLEFDAGRYAAMQWQLKAKK